MLSILQNDALGKLILRVSVGGLMLFHGISKLGNTATLDFIGTQLAAHGLPAMLAYGVYVGEILAPIMLIAGIYSRLGAVLVMANMLVAIGLVHMHDLFALTEHGGWRLELQGFYLFGALALVFLGSGRYALRAD